MTKNKSFKVLLVILCLVSSNLKAERGKRLDAKVEEKADGKHDGDKGGKKPDAKPGRKVTDTDLKPTTVELFAKFLGKEKDVVEKDYKDRKIAGKTLAESLIFASEAKKEDGEQPFESLTHFIAERETRLSSKEWDDMYKYLGEQMKKMSGVDGDKVGDPQTEMLVKALWWTMHVDTDKPETTKIKKPEVAEFNKAAIKALADEKKTAEEIQKKIELAKGGDAAAKAALRGDPTKPADDPANKYAITGPGLAKLLGKIPEAKAADIASAIAWQDGPNKAIYFHTPTGAKEVTFTDANEFAKMFKDPASMAKLGKWDFSATKIEGAAKLTSKGGKLTDPNPTTPPTTTAAVSPAAGAAAGAAGAVASAEATYKGKCTTCHAADKYSKEDQISALTGANGKKKMPPDASPIKVSSEEIASIRTYLSAK